MPLDSPKYMQACTHDASAEVISSVVEALSVKRNKGEPWLCPAVIATALADEEHEQHALPASPVTRISSEALKKAQEGDLMISKILQYLKENQWSKVKNSDETTKTFLRERSKLYQDENDVLYRKTVTRSQLVLPKSFHKLVLQQLHQEMGYLGVERTLHLIRDVFCEMWSSTSLKSAVA